MHRPPVAIERLSREELISPAYHRLAGAAFGVANWERHVRYCLWLYGENPWHRRVERLPIYVCRDGDELIGQLAVIPAPVWLKETRLDAAWAVDLFVLPAYRRQQVAGQLLMAALRDFPLLVSLGQSDAGRQVVIKNGWQVAGSMSHYRRLLRPWRCITKKALDTFGCTAAAERIFSVPAVHPPSLPSGVTMEPVTSFAAIADQTTDLRGAGSGPRPMRNAAFMQWRYCDHPLFRYTVRRISIESHGEAYAVWRHSDDGLWRRAFLVDVVYPEGLPAGALAQITAAVSASVHAEGAEVFHCRTNDPAILNALGGGFMSTTEAGPQFLYHFSTGAAVPQVPVNRWRLFAGDCDVDTYMARQARE